jgi:hypothetical protein
VEPAQLGIITAERRIVHLPARVFAKLRAALEFIIVENCWKHYLAKSQLVGLW